MRWGEQAQGWLFGIPSCSGAQEPSLVVWYLPWVTGQEGSGPMREPLRGGGRGSVDSGMVGLHLKSVLLSLGTG